MYERTPAPEAIEDAFAALQRNMWTMLPGTIVTYTAAGSTASVQPLPADYVAGAIVPMPVLHDVRVLWPGGAGGRVTGNLVAGNRVMLLFAARSLDRYLTDGVGGDPQSVRTHSLSDAVALPFDFAPDASAVTTTGDLVLVQPTGGKVLLGGSGGAAVVRDGDAVDMTAGGASSWLTWAALVNAELGGIPGLPASPPVIVASSTTVEAT